MERKGHPAFTKAGKITRFQNIVDRKVRACLFPVIFGKPDRSSKRGGATPKMYAHVV